MVTLYALQVIDTSVQSRFADFLSYINNIIKPKGSYLRYIYRRIQLWQNFFITRLIPETMQIMVG